MLFWSLYRTGGTPRALWSLFRGLAGPHTRLGMPLWSLLRGLARPHTRLGMPLNARLAGLHARLGMPLWMKALIEDGRDSTRALGCLSGGSFRGLAGPAPWDAFLEAGGTHARLGMPLWLLERTGGTPRAPWDAFCRLL